MSSQPSLFEPAPDPVRADAPPDWADAWGPWCIGRCSVKGCRYVHRARSAVVRTTARRMVGAVVHEYRTTRVAELLAPGSRRLLGPDDLLSRADMRKCPTHDRFPAYRPIRGYVTDTRCDARCTGATGADCECSCGGANHGADHAL